MRRPAVGAAVLLAAFLVALVAVPAAAAPDPVTPRLGVTPDATVAGTAVEVVGRCPALGDVAIAVPGEHVVTTSLGGGDTVRVSVPEAPGTPAPAGSVTVPNLTGAVVRIELATDEPPGSFPLLPAAGGGGLLLLLLAATPLTVHRRRLRRERRWLDGDVEVAPGGRVPLPSADLPGSAPGLHVRIGVHRHRWPPAPPHPGGPAP